MDTLLLVEDDPPTRAWLRDQVLRLPSIASVHDCALVSEASAWMAVHPLDVLLVDLGLPDGSGLSLIAQARQRHPACEVLVLSALGDEHTVLAALDAGANGYLLKDGHPLTLGTHLHHLREGGSPLSPRIACTLVRRFQGLGAPTIDRLAHDAGSQVHRPHVSPLSAREDEVLAGLSKGFSYAEVAQMLGITPNTVRTHVRKLYDKLAVHSRSEAVYEYQRLGAGRAHAA
jgi:DNA-binding NarL/FixJ family response regulator